MQVLHAVRRVDGLLEAQDEGERQYDAVVAEAEAEAAASGGDHLVGIVQEVLQQRINAPVGGPGAGHQALPEAPAGVIDPETVDHTLLPEQVVETQVQFGHAVHVGRDVVQVVGKGVWVNEGLRPLRILKNRGHLLLAAQELLLELLEFPVQGVVRRALGDHDALVGRNVMHVVLARVHGDVQRRIQRLELQAEVRHAEHDAPGGGGIRLHEQRFRQQRGIVVVHPSGDGLVLPGAERRELAGAAFRVGRRDFDAAADILSVVRQEVQRPGRVQLLAQPAVRLVAGHVPSAMTAVMADVERLIPRRRRGQVAGGDGIVGIVAGR